MKNWVKKIIATVGLSVFLSIPLAAEPPESSNDNPLQGAPLMDHYRDYNNARYAVQWPVTPGSAQALRSRLGRYHYLVFYTSPQMLNASGGPLLQFGFFANREDAQKFVSDNQAIFPGIRSVAVTEAEHQSLFAGDSPEVGDFYWVHPGRQDRHAGAQAIMKQARAFYLDGDYNRALSFYSLLSLVSGSDLAQWARELMGLTYERIGQRDQAMAVYRDLLTEPDQGAWGARVGQRLRALETAGDDGHGALRKAADAQQPFYWRGTFGNAYNYMYRSGAHVPDQDLLSVIATHYDLIAGYRHPDHDFEVRLTGYDQYDLMERGGRFSSDNKTVIRRAQLDYTHRDTGLNLVGGRQRDYNSGMFQHFDGLSIKYPVTDRIRVGVTAGVPVQFSRFYDYMDRRFYSVQGSYDINQHWSLGGYLTHQTVYGETDRSAYGGRVQYRSSRFSSHFNFDYDYEFAEFNIVRWQGSYNLSPSSQLSGHYGRQRSPFLSATNILLGQPYLNLEQYLQSEFNRDYLLYMSLQRTSLMEYGSLSYQYRVDENLHISTDIYHSVTSEIPIFNLESDLQTSVVAFNGAEYRYSSAGVQAVANDFFGIQDTATLGYRYSDTTLSSSHLVHVADRLRFFSNKLFVTPKVQLKYTQRHSNDAAQTNLRGSLNLTYRPWRNVEFRLEAGNEAIRDHDQKNHVEYSYLFVGYQARF